MKHKFILSLIIIILLLAGGWIYFRYFFNLLGECSQQISSESISPSQHYSAQKVLVNCGATSDYATKVVVKNISNSNKQTVLSLKGDHTKSCQAEWGNDMLLNIKCTGNIESIYDQTKQFENIQINFTQ